ncbi:MAG: DnaD domain protein [Clostridia bacterium]|nr:DnaD domain protein [Clostridia bacterium]
MAFFSFAEGSSMFDTTPIENLFLIDFLPVAPEGCLRVYLYARMLALHPELGGDLSDTAKALHMEEEAVFEAFTYWERQGLVRRVTDRPPTYELLPVRAESAAGSAMERDYYAYRDFNAELQGLFGARVIESHEYRIANDWLNVLGYDQDAALRLVKYGIETSRSKAKTPSPASVFRRMDKLAVTWADRGCRSLEDVERAIAQEENIYPVAEAVLKRFSLRREPTLDELDCATRWVKEWKCTQEDVLDACGETIKTAKPSFAYLDAILKSRLEKNSAFFNETKEVLKELDATQAQPTPDQLQRYAALRAAGFEPETVRLAAVQCHRKKKTRFEDVEWMLKEWGAQGLFTRADAEAYIGQMQRKAARVRALLEAAGLERRPTMNDLALYDAWQARHGEDVIEYAATCARGMQMPMKYMDKLLTDWAGEGIATVEDARARHEAARTPAASPAKAGAANPALDYAQREYRDEDYGDDFFIDLDKYGEEGDGK